MRRARATPRRVIIFLYFCVLPSKQGNDQVHAKHRTPPYRSLTGQRMNLPFTPTQFFAVFTSYNEAVWPMQIILVLVAVTMAAAVLRFPERAGRIVSAGLALLWCWLGLGYHLAFFWAINPAAPLFAAISLAGSGAFLWLGLFKTSLRFQRRPEWEEDRRTRRHYICSGNLSRHRCAARPSLSCRAKLRSSLPHHDLHLWHPDDGGTTLAQSAAARPHDLGDNRRLCCFFLRSNSGPVLGSHAGTRRVYAVSLSAK